MSASAYLIDLWDRGVDAAGVRYYRQSLAHDNGPNVTTLDIAGYRQTQSFTCGFSAGLSVLHTYFPKKSPKAFLRKVAPDTEMGTTNARLIRALRQSGIGVRVAYKLDFDSIARTIDAGFPIIVLIAAAENLLHWCVIYGARRRPHRSVFVAGNGFLRRKEIPWAEFRRDLWSPVGFGLVCWGT